MALPQTTISNSCSLTPINPRDPHCQWKPQAPGRITEKWGGLGCSGVGWFNVEEGPASWASKRRPPAGQGPTQQGVHSTDMPLCSSYPPQSSLHPTPWISQSLVYVVILPFLDMASISHSQGIQVPGLGFQALFKVAPMSLDILTS